MSDAGITAIGGDGHIIEDAAAVGELEVLEQLANRCVNDANTGGNAFGVGPATVQMVCDHQQLPVGGEGGGDRLAVHGDAGGFFAGDKVDDREVVVKTVTDVDCIFVVRKHRGHCRMAGGN